MKFNPYHIVCDRWDIIDGLGIIFHNYVMEPLMDSVPHFHVMVPKSNKIVSICYLHNRYADPRSKDRLTEEECKILNDWMKTIPYCEYDEDFNLTNWKCMVNFTHIIQPWWSIVRNSEQPDYSTISEPLPLNHDKYEIDKHCMYAIRGETDFGKFVGFSVEDEDMYQRPHFHLVMNSGKHVEICIFENRYANPNNPNILTDQERKEFSEWVKQSKDNLNIIKGCWYGAFDGPYDERCTIPASAKQCTDYSEILPAKPIKEYDEKLGPKLIGECPGVGKIFVFKEIGRLYWSNNMFWVLRMEDLIPIGINDSVYYNSNCKKLSKKERNLLADWMSSKADTSFRDMTNWEYMAMTYEINSGKWLESHKMPNYRNIRVSKKCSW